MAVDNISITITQNSQNIANNTSSITVTGKCRTTGPSYDYYSRTGSVTIDGKKYSFSSTFPENSTITIFSKTVTITHNADGKKSVSASFTVTTGMTGTLPDGVISASTSKTLTTIPRTSKVSLSSTNFTIGNTITINTNRASSSFTHTAKIVFDGKTVRTQQNIGASYSWDTSELASIIPSKESASGTVTLTTYNGSTSIGTSSVNFTARIASGTAPIFNNFEVTDANSTTINLTGDNTKFIRKYSSARVRIRPEYKMIAQNSASPDYYNVVVGNQSRVLAYSDSAEVFTTISNMDTNVVSVFAVDSRNAQTVVQKSLNIINYTECSIENAVVERIDGTGTSVKLSLSGTYSNVNFGSVTNDLTVAQIRYKQTGTNTWESWRSILTYITRSGGRFYCTDRTLSGVTFTLGTNYDIEVQVQDRLSTASITFDLNSGTVLMSAVKNKGVCFGGIYDTSVGGALQNKGNPVPAYEIIQSFNTPDGIKKLVKMLDVESGTNISSLSVIEIDKNISLDDIRETGIYFLSSDYSYTNMPYGYEGFLIVLAGKYQNDNSMIKQIFFGRVVASEPFYTRTTSPQTGNFLTWQRFWNDILNNNTGTKTTDLCLTTTNSNPSSELGGSWSLIDKQFADKYVSNSSSNATKMNCSVFDVWGNLSGHTVTLEMHFTPNVNLADSATTIGTINLSRFGLYGTDVAHYFVGRCDGGNGVLMLQMSTSGVIQCDDVVIKGGGTSLDSGNSCQALITITAQQSDMYNSFCDKFFWKKN